MSPQADPLLQRRIDRAHLDLTVQQLKWMPLSILLVDPFVLWILASVDLLGPGLLWLAIMMGVQALRWSIVRRELRRPSEDPARVQAWLNGLFVLLGLLRTLIAVPVFMQPIGHAHYALTMVHCGLAGAGVASVGSLLRPYMGWTVVSAGGLMLAWILGAEAGADRLRGEVIALMLLSMSFMLSHVVRDNGRHLRDFVRLAHEREKLADSLTVERDRVSHAHESKTRFFAAAGHDLRQPLHALALNTTLLGLRSRQRGDAELTELGHRMDQSLQQTQALLDSLLELSRLDAQAVQPRPGPVALGPLLAALQRDHAAQAARRGLRWEVATEAAAGLWVWSDPDWLRRILDNLVGNALKFTERGGVSVQPIVHPQGVQLIVLDSGIGIAPEEQQRVFDEFVQVDNPARDRHHGLGLGLAIVRRLCALLDIRLGLQSQLGQGSRFELLLPAADPARPEEGGPRTAASPSLPAGLRLLVVDDDEAVRQAMVRLLQALGAVVRSAADAEQALAQVSAAQDRGWPQLLLIDQRLGSTLGSELIPRLRQRCGPRPALLITGDALLPDLQALHDGGGLQVLHKPVDGQQLAAAIAALLDRPVADAPAIPPAGLPGSPPV